MKKIKGKYTCEECGQDLEKQEGFDAGKYNTWICTECRHFNRLEQDSKETSTYELPDEKLDEFNTDFEFEEEKVEEEEKDEKKGKGLKGRALHFLGKKLKKDKKGKKLKWKLYLVVAGVLLLLLVSAVIKARKATEIRFSYNHFVGRNQEEVVSEIESYGFTRIETNVIHDLPLEFRDYEQTVADVRIGKKNTFSASDKFAYDEKIVVSYHALLEVSIPFSNRDFKNMNYQDAVERFQQAGFVNVVTRAETSMFSGLLDNAGNVREVTINGDSHFREGEMFIPDVEVVITYNATEG